MVFWNETEASEMFLFLRFLRGMLLFCCLIEVFKATKFLNAYESCIYQFYSCIHLKIIFQNTSRIKCFLPYKDRLNRSQTDPKSFISFVVGIGTEHFKSLTKYDHSSAIAQGPEEMCLSLEQQNPSKTSEKNGLFWSRYSFVTHPIYRKPRDWGLARSASSKSFFYSALRVSVTFIKMPRKLTTFITAVCVLFLIKISKISKTAG